MSILRAAVIIKNVHDDYKTELFDHFIEHFNIVDEEEASMFAIACGFKIAKKAEPTNL